MNNNNDSIAIAITGVGMVVFSIVCIILNRFGLLFLLLIPASIVFYILGLYISSIVENFKKGKMGAAIIKICSPLAIAAIIVFLCVSNGGSRSGGGSSKCTICKDRATDTFQGSPYCRDCYKDAIIWAMDNLND